LVSRELFQSDGSLVKITNSFSVNILETCGIISFLKSRGGTRTSYHSRNANVFASLPMTVEDS